LAQILLFFKYKLKHKQKKMANLSWAGIISKGILKMKLAFDKSVKAPDRVKIMKHWAQEVSNSDVNIIETKHFDTMSSIKAILKPKN